MSNLGIGMTKKFGPTHSHGLWLGPTTRGPEQGLRKKSSGLSPSPQLKKNYKLE